MTELTEDEYGSYMKAQNKFKAVLISCAQEISMITNDRELIGEFNDDITMTDNYRYYVKFEDFRFGDYSYDGIYVPVEYLYDAGFHKEYNQYLVRERKRKEIAARNREEERKAHTYRVIVDERTEYERLKVKFETEDD
ncbi:MAG: hypothetical protein ACTSPB_17640 [Candidatus Thorarchaeota archaeon]